MDHVLEPVLLLLTLSVLAVVACRLLKQPPILGYLFAGVLIGPHALGWIPANETIALLGEVGVVFLMFSIGLEFSLTRLKKMHRTVFGLGGAQVVASLVGAPLFGLVLGLGWQTGLALGGILSMSSTAIVSKLLNERFEIDSAHGREIFGVLLFQDLAVVPLLILIPALSAAPSGGEILKRLGIAALEAIAVLIVVFYLGEPLLRRWFHMVARRRSSELFILNVLLVTLGIAWLTSLAQLSLVLGAFLAGILISETEYRFEVEDTIRPFRDVLLGLFFVTIGMKLDPFHLADHWNWTLGFIAILVPAKLALISGLARLFKHSSEISLRTGLYLAQAGEFGFVLLALATNGPHALVSQPLQNSLLSAMVIAMCVSPILIQQSDRIVSALNRSKRVNRSLTLTHIAKQSMALEEHVLICGYGRSGQYLARLLSAEAVPCSALDLDPERLREAQAAGENVAYGDATKKETLIAAGLDQARALVITFADTHAAQRIIAHAHGARPELPVIVRTYSESEVAPLKAAGADEVVAETLEGSLMLTSHTLIWLGIPTSRVLRMVRHARERQYALFKGIFVGDSDIQEANTDHFHARLRSIHVPDTAFAVGKTFQQLALEQYEVELRSLRRRSIRHHLPSQDSVVQADDTLVLLGTPEHLAGAERRILQG